MATRYFRLRLDGQLYGLIRRRDDARGAARSFASVEGGEWVRDADLFRYWLDPGDTDLVEVDAADARRAADELGVDLAGKIARTVPVEDVP